ncbi:hypothetical protein HK101_010291 [Irineochytrium annulatum]|nr:hypothetical protein HK101_010291 [Irineochytrium annulatum]
MVCWTTLSSCSIDVLRKGVTDAISGSALSLRAAVLLVSASHPRPAEIPTMSCVLRSSLHAAQRSTPATPIVGTVVSSLGRRGHTVSVALLEAAPEVRVDAFFIPTATKVRRKAVGRWPDLSMPVGGRDAFSAEDGGFEGMSKFGADPDRDGGGANAMSVDVPDVDGLGKTPGDLTILFSDNDPHAFLRSFDAKYRSVAKVGLIGARTPFITGADHCLFFGEDILSGGTVGLTIMGPKDQLRVQVGKILYRGRGNILSMLQPLGGTSDLSAAAYLNDQVAAIPSSNVSNDHSLYCMVRSSSASDASRRVYKIASGDLSNGAVAVDTQWNIDKSSNIQFMRPLKGAVDVNVIEPDGLHFSACSEDECIPPVEGGLPDHKGTLLEAASDCGIIFGIPKESSDVSIVPSSFVQANKKTN